MAPRAPATRRSARSRSSSKERGLLKGKADGLFDARTKDAVQKLERSKGWLQDGVVGLRMWKLLTGKGKQAEVHAQQAGGSDHGGRPVVHGGAGTEAGSPVDGSEGVGAAAASHKKGTWEFKTVNINVKSNPEMSQDKVLHDVQRRRARATSSAGTRSPRSATSRPSRASARAGATTCPKTTG